MERVADRIVRVFEDRGYELLDRAGERVTFRKGREGLSIQLLQVPLTAERLPAVAQGERAIVVVLAGADLKSLSEAESRGVEVWDRERFRREIGDLLMDEAFGRSEAAAEKDAEEPERIEEGVAEPSVARERALEMAARVGPFRCEMVHVPWYLLQVEVRGSERRRVALAVNAISGEVRPWKKWFNVRKEAPWPHVDREPKFDSRRACELATEALREMLASSETRKEHGSVTVVKKDFESIGEQNVRVTGAGLFQMPHWCVEGVRGMMVINAATGAVVEESYFEDVKR
jgi:hypothetical protein